MIEEDYNEKKVYTRRELVHKVIEESKSYINVEVKEKGFCDIKEFKIVLDGVYALLTLNIIAGYKYLFLCDCLDEYRHKKNEERVSLYNTLNAYIEHMSGK